jgi:hypothetical protein
MQQQGDTLEPWQQSKVTKAADYLDAVFNSVDDEHDMGEAYGRRDAYQRDYDSSVSGMDGSYHRAFKRAEMDHELGHERNNYAVAIDGRTWKVFADKRQAENIARSLQNKGKNASVHETGADPTESVDPYFESLSSKLDQLKKK